MSIIRVSESFKYGKMKDESDCMYVFNSIGGYVEDYNQQYSFEQALEIAGRCIEHRTDKNYAKKIIKALRETEK